MSVPNVPQVTPSAMPAAHPRGVPSPVRFGPIGPRLLLRGVFVALALFVLVLLLAGCGSARLPAAPPPPPPAPTPTTSASPTPTPTTTPAPTTTSPPSTTPAPAASRSATTGGAAGHRTHGRSSGPGGGTARSGTGSPLWPAGNAAQARTLQRDADNGADPWLLDPEEVTLSYVGSELNYRDPRVNQLAPGTFAVADGRSPAHATITLEQIVRRGPGGIWLVTAVDRS